MLCQSRVSSTMEAGHIDVVLCLLSHGSIPIAEDERGNTVQDVSHTAVSRIVKEHSDREYVCIQFLSPSNGFAAESSMLVDMWKQNIIKEV